MNQAERMSADRHHHDSNSAKIAKLVRTPADSTSGQSGRVVRTAFISDLHLLTSRCDYQRHATSIRHAVEASEVCVWGGDLFDFCWSIEGDGPASRKIAIEWLQQWRSEFPEKTFVYLTGNHDAQPEFQEALSRWSLQNSDSQNSDSQNSDSPFAARLLTIRPDAVHVGLDAIRLGDCLMVHGDVIEGNKIEGNKIEGHGIDSGLARYRSRWQHERTGRPRPPMIRNQLYNAAVTARLHLATASVAHRRKNVCMRLMHWIRGQPDWFGEGVRRVVFGHTHRRLDGIRIADYEFYNAGAAVKHVAFEPVVLDVRVPPEAAEDGKNS